MGVENNIYEGWVETTLGNTCELLDCLHRTPKYSNFGYPMVRVTDVKNGPLETNGCLKVDVNTFNDFSKNYQPIIGDIVFTRVGSFGLSAIVKKEEQFCIGQNTTLILAKRINSFFLFYYLISKAGRHQIIALSSGSTQPTISMANIREIHFNLPPLPEQKAIAKVLIAFDDKIELLQAQNKTLETMAQTIFKEWFGKHQIGDELPEGWRIGKLGNEFDITIGRTPPRKETQWFSDKPIGKKWISIKDMGNCGTFIYNTSEYLTDEAIEKFNIPIIPINTTILSFKMTVGKLTITTEDMLSNEAIAHLKIKNHSLLTSEFIYLFLKDLNFNLLGSTSSIVTAINSTIIKGIEFIIPKDNLLNSFQKKIIPVFGKIKNNTSQIQSLTKTRDALLPKLMSGQVRVKNLKQTVDA